MMLETSLPQTEQKEIKFALGEYEFTGTLLKVYAERPGVLMMAVIVNGFTVGGRWFPSQADGSAVQVSMECLR